MRSRWASSLVLALLLTLLSVPASAQEIFVISADRVVAPGAGYGGRDYYIWLFGVTIWVGGLSYWCN